MRRGALYGRYSTDLQNEQSVEDQFRLCRKFTEQHGIEIVRTFDDRGISGATIAARPGVRELMKAAERKEFDCIVVESLSRLSRCPRRVTHPRRLFRARERRRLHPRTSATASRAPTLDPERRTPS